VGVFDIIHKSEKGTAFTMELCNGGTLKQMISEKLSDREVVDLMLGIAKGLDFIHSRNFIHRDIKPDNILMHNGIPKIGKCEF
jgi:serine/threonine-protein kinase ULK/ATG1